MMAPPRTASSEGVMLIPAITKRNTTGYKNVTFHRSRKKFVAEVRDGGKCVHLGYFDTAEEAAIAYAQSECGRADAAKLLQPRPAPTPAGAEAIRQAAREGLTLATSGSSTGYKGVSYNPKKRGSKKYHLQVTVGGKKANLGLFATAEQAAEFRAWIKQEYPSWEVDGPPAQIEERKPRSKPAKPAQHAAMPLLPLMPMPCTACVMAMPIPTPMLNAPFVAVSALPPSPLPMQPLGFVPPPFASLM